MFVFFNLGITGNLSSVDKNGWDYIGSKNIIENTFRRVSTAMKTKYINKPEF